MINKVLIWNERKLEKLIFIILRYINKNTLNEKIKNKDKILQNNNNYILLKTNIITNNIIYYDIEAVPFKEYIIDPRYYLLYQFSVFKNR